MMVEKHSGRVKDYVTLAMFLLVTGIYGCKVEIIKDGKPIADKTVESTVHDRVTLRCHADCELGAKPEVFWYRTENLLSSPIHTNSGDRVYQYRTYFKLSSTLHIKDLQESDYGTYRCYFQLENGWRYIEIAITRETVTTVSSTVDLSTPNSNVDQVETIAIKPKQTEVVTTADITTASVTPDSTAVNPSTPNNNLDHGEEVELEQKEVDTKSVITTVPTVPHK